MKTIRNIITVMACGVLFAGCCSSQQPKEMVVQLYSVRDLIGNPELYAQNHVQVLQAIADMGYTGVEAAHYDKGLLYGISPEEFKADMEAAGLEVVSSHINRGLTEAELASGDFSEGLAWWDEAITAHKAAGMKYIVCPWLGVPETLKDLKSYCDYYNEIGRRCKAAGMEFGYHNHAHEFSKVDDVVMLDYMLQNTDPELVFFQMDVYWVVYGNASPVEYFENYPGRWKVLHIKDKKEIGQSGMVGFDAIFKNADTAGMKDYIIEVEGCRNEKALDGLRVSAEYMNSLPISQILNN